MNWGVMSVDVITETDIRRPIGDVAAYVADPTNAPEWYDKIASIEWQTEPPVEVGSRMDFVAHFLRRRLAYTYEVVELVPGERLVMRTAEGPFPMETSYVWTENDDGSTHMTLRNRGEPEGYSRMLSPIMVPAIRRANRKDLSNLKSLLESR